MRNRLDIGHPVDLFPHAAVSALSLLDIGYDDLQVRYPPPVDDLYQLRRVVWDCRYKGEHVGGARMWSDMIAKAAPETTEEAHRRWLARDVVFSLLLLDRPERKALQRALEIERHRNGRHWGFVRSYLSWRLGVARDRVRIKLAEAKWKSLCR